MIASRVRIAQCLCLGVLALALAPVAAAVRDPGSNSGSGCVQSAPKVTIDNTFAWASPGSWGLPGQQLRYAVRVSNRDSGCSASSFVVRMSGPSGFAMSLPTNTATLSSGASVYFWAYVTSPTTGADGDYPLTAAVERAGSSGSTATSVYKLYSSDTVAPKLYWMNPADGGALSGRTAYVGFASSDDHAVKQVDVLLDNTLVASTACDNITYECQVSYKWSIRRARGQHTATYRSTDWMGNVASQTATFTVN